MRELITKTGWVARPNQRAGRGGALSWYRAGSDGKHGSPRPALRLGRATQSSGSRAGRCILAVLLALVISPYLAAQEEVLPSPPDEPTEIYFNQGQTEADEQATTQQEVLPTPAGEFAEELEPGQTWLDFPAFAHSSGDWYRNGYKYVQLEFVALYWEQLQDVDLSRDDSQLGDPVVLRTEDDTPLYEPGGRLTIGKQIGRDCYNRDQLVELRFFGGFDWSANAQASEAFPGFGGIDTVLGPLNGPVAGLFNNTSHRYELESSLNNVEVNLRLRTRSARDRLVLQPDGSWVKHSTPSKLFSGYVGWTNFFINDDFLLASTGGADQATYTVGTDNWLTGVQFGGEYLEQYTWWRWGVRGRIGGLVNNAKRTSRLVSTVGPSDFSETLDEGTMAFLLEGGLFGAFHFNPNVTLRSGYDFLYLSGISMATDNLGLPPGGFTPLDVGGDRLYHGGWCGFEMVW